MILGINLPAPEMGAFLQFVLSTVAGGGILLLVLKIYLSGQEVFGRKPAINVEFEAVGKRHSDLERKGDGPLAGGGAGAAGGAGVCVDRGGACEPRMDAAEG